METILSQNKRDYFEWNTYREEIFRKIFCDFEHFIWDWDIKFLEKFHDFCQNSAVFSDIADNIYYCEHINHNDCENTIIKNISDFLESLIPHLYTNTHLQTQYDNWFSQKEISYIRKKLLAFIYYPNKELLKERKTIKEKTNTIIFLQNYNH